MDDMRCADIDFLTMGQYLQPTQRHAKVIEFVTPQAFGAYGAIARSKGFLQVAASPLTRSSYHAGDDFRQMRAARGAAPGESAPRRENGGLMPSIHEVRRLPYSAEQMFDLVADVGRYGEFLPWVMATRVRSDDGTELVADMLVGFSAIREKFTSRVEQRRPQEELRVHYVDGPLRDLDNRWLFRPLGRAGMRDRLLGRIHLPQRAVREARRPVPRSRLPQDGRGLRRRARRSFTAAIARARPAPPDGARRRGLSRRAGVPRHEPHRRREPPWRRPRCPRASCRCRRRARQCR